MTSGSQAPVKDGPKFGGERGGALWQLAEICHACDLSERADQDCDSEVGMCVAAQAFARSLGGDQATESAENCDGTHLGRQRAEVAPQVFQNIVEGGGVLFNELEGGAECAP